MIIVLARMDECSRVVCDDGIDIGARRVIELYMSPAALVWKSNADESSLAKAREHASKDGWTVFTLDDKCSDPINAAKELIRNNMGPGPGR